MDPFTAGVQYNDFNGSVAADVSDNIALKEHLVALGVATDKERVVAFRIASSGITGAPVEDVSLVAYLVSSEEFEARPAEVRAVEIRATPGEALAFFKRFDLVAKRAGMDFSKTKVDGPHYG